MSDDLPPDAGTHGAPPVTRQWGVMAVETGLSGRGDWAAQDLRRALAAGWEPFAVADGHIWLRKFG